MNKNDWWNYNVDERCYKEFAEFIGLVGKLESWHETGLKILFWYADRRGLDYKILTPKKFLDVLLSASKGCNGYARYVRLLILHCYAFHNNDQYGSTPSGEDIFKQSFGRVVSDPVSLWYLDMVKKRFLGAAFREEKLIDDLEYMITDYKISYSQTIKFERQILISLFAGVNTVVSLESRQKYKSVEVTSSTPLRVRTITVPKYVKADNYLKDILDSDSMHILESYRCVLSEDSKYESLKDILNMFVKEKGGCEYHEELVE